MVVFSRLRFHAQTNPLRLFNHALTGVVATLALYVLIAPFWPQVTWWLQHDAPTRHLLAPAVVTAAPAPGQVIDPQSEELLLPSAGLDQAINEGDMRALRKGVWRLPQTSTPDKGGNTVLVGHRFTYDGPAVFYHLDKVNVGDPLTLLWHGNTYRYQVFNIMVVPPSDVSVEAATAQPRLTIYTCTPLWSAKDRLVIQARLVGDQS